MTLYMSLNHLSGLFSYLHGLFVQRQLFSLQLLHDALKLYSVKEWKLTDFEVYPMSVFFLILTGDCFAGILDVLRIFKI